MVKFKRVEAIVEENISDEGSKAGRAVPADEIGLNPQDWEANSEFEAFLSYPFEIKDTIDWGEASVPVTHWSWSIATAQ